VVGVGGRTGPALLRLPRPVGLGLAAPFARPARTMVTLAAIAFGATAVIFAVGLNIALGRIVTSESLTATAPVQLVLPYGLQSGAPSAGQDAAAAAALRAEPGALHDVAMYDDAQVKVPGITGNVDAQVFGGDASWLGYAIIAGRWYNAPGDVDVNTTFLNSSDLAVGDTATVVTGTSQVTVDIAAPASRTFDRGSSAVRRSLQPRL
jgi:putative ABC transport system permease protein